MSENREEILADFQACTGIEDVGEAIYHLEETNWDLLSAVNRVMPADSQAFVPHNDADVMIVDDEPAISIGSARNNVATETKTTSHKESTVNDDHKNYPSTSSGSGGPKMLNFNVKYCDRMITIKLPDTATVGDLKIALNKELNISPCRMTLTSWARLSQYENTPFSKLMLPAENNLQLTVKTSNDGSSDSETEVTEKLNGTYILHVKFEEKTYDLNYPGIRTILQVKTDVYTLTNVHVRNQAWSGWPPNIDENTMLALSGISYPEHNLVLERNMQANHQKEKKSLPQIVHLDSDDDEFEDASESFTVEDDYFVDNDISTKRMEPLIPDNVEDEIVGSITFSENFTARYGPIHPPFYQGTLEDALKEACSKPAKDRKILAIYLHHDSSVLTNVFCTQLLGFESVMQMIEKNFVLWGWDITFESNRQRFQTAVANCLGSTAALSLRNIPVDRLPAMVLIMRIRSTTEVFSVINGNVGVNELLSTLIECVEVYSGHQTIEVKEEQERAERELVKWEQDQAFHESLEADRAKEEAKRMQEQVEVETRKRIENEQAESAAKKEAHRKKVEAGLPSEPALDQGDGITKIRFRLPKGKHIERRFHANTPLKVLLDFLVVEGFPTDEYKVISSWPRRDLTTLDANQTLKDLKLYPQETVILEER